MSVRKGWNRLYQKQSPSKKVNYSPLCQTQHLVGKDRLLDEGIFRTHIWTLFNTEEFHYQNGESLVYQNYENPQKLAKILKDHINITQWNSRLNNYRRVGMGANGEVYQATDKKTKVEYALKIITSPKKCGDQKYLIGFLQNLLVERNIFSELNKSSFFVRMVAAFQSSDQSQFFFVMEFCICDLERLMSSYHHYDDDKKLESNFRTFSSFKNVTFAMSRMFKTDYEHLIFVYLFEMSCSLHYLASRHIVHADIKPQNILVSLTGHIKLSDFGVSFRNDWFNRNSIVMLPSSVKEMELANAEDNKVKSVGDADYHDPEIKYRGASQTFLSDLYAVGLVAMQLITGGIQISLNTVLPFNFDKVIFDKDRRNDLLVDPIRKMSLKETTLSVFDFILDILLPRPQRAVRFTTESVIFQQKKIVPEFHIEIEKVENILYYKSNLITKESVLNIKFSDSFISELNERLRKRKMETKFEKQEKIYNNMHTFGYG